MELQFCEVITDIKVRVGCKALDHVRECAAKNIRCGISNIDVD